MLKNNLEKNIMSAHGELISIIHSNIYMSFTHLLS